MNNEHLRRLESVANGEITDPKESLPILVESLRELNKDVDELEDSK